MGYIVVVIRQVKSNRKDRVSHKIIFKSKGHYRILVKATPSLFWLQRLRFGEGLGTNRRELNESEASMKNIPFTIVLHKHVDGYFTLFNNMAGPLVKNL